MAHQTNVPKTAAQMVNEARSRVETLEPERVATELKQGAMLVDLRESDERAEQGAIAGALHFPRGMLEFWADPSCSSHRPEFERDRRIIFYCMAGARSALAADCLQQLGFKSVAHMDGGFERWRQEGRPVQGGA